MLLIKYIVTLLSFVASGLALSATTITGVELEHRLFEGNTTQYNKLLSTLQRDGLAFDVEISPIKRVIRDFIGHNQCIFPSSLDAIKSTAPQYQSIAMIQSNPVDYVSLHVFTKQGRPIIRSMSELNGKTVGLWLGYDLENFHEGLKVTIETTPTEEIRVKMLDRERVDAAISFIPDVNIVADKYNIPRPNYDKNLALLDNIGASLLCHDTPNNRVFISRFNEMIDDLKASGELRRILGEHAIIR